MKTQKRINPYVLITILTLTALLLSVALTVMANGKTYTVVFDERYFSDPVDREGVGVSYTEEGIVETEEIYLENDKTVCIRVRSLKSGNTDLILHVKGTWSQTASLYVNPSGTVIETPGLNFNGYQYAEGVILFSFAFVALMMLLAFIDRYKKRQFDYTMIAYNGVAIFSAALSAYPLAKTLSWLPVRVSFGAFIGYVTETGLYFVLVSAPVMLIVCAAFAFSNIRLIRHEGFRPVNLLGIALSVVWFIGASIIFSRGVLWFFIGDAEMTHIIYYGTAYAVSLMICLLFSVMISAVLAVRCKPPYDKDYIIILGCCIRSNGDLTPLLRGRVDSALAFEKKQFDATGRHAKFVPSGGQGADEIISESEAMKRYLLAQGVPEERILKEDRSVNTDQNIAFSREVIAQDCEDIESVKAGFATTNYHILRGYVLSKKHRLDAQGISAKTKWYFFPNAFLREFIGLLVDKKLAIGLIMLLITAMFIWINRLLGLIY